MGWKDKLKVGGSIGATAETLKKRSGGIVEGAAAGGAAGGAVGAVAGGIAGATGVIKEGDVGREIDRALDKVKGALPQGPQSPELASYEIDQEIKNTSLDRSANRQMTLEESLAKVQNRKALERNSTSEAGTRMAQADFVTALQNSAAGRGPSAAQAQLQMGTDANMRQALAMAASSRGNPALAGMQASRDRTLASQTQASQAAALRASEIQAAQGQLGGALQGMRGQDLQASTTDLQAAMSQQAQRDAMSQFYDQGITGQVDKRNATDYQYEALKAGQIESANQMAMSKYQTDKAAHSQQMSGLIGGATTVGAVALPALMASDERKKKNVSDVQDDSLAEFFQALRAKNYEYKNPDEPMQSNGEKVGMMAKDVADTELGSKLFQDTGDGKAYDPQVLDGILLASIKKLMDERRSA